MSIYFDNRSRSDRAARRARIYCVGGDIAMPTEEAIVQWQDDDLGDLPERFILRKPGWIVCPVCEGEKTHVTPTVDAGGLTDADFADDPDFAEHYFGGRYDVTCSECAGQRVVRGAAECDHPLWPAWQAWVAEQCEDDPADVAEARYFGW